MYINWTMSAYSLVQSIYPNIGKITAELDLSLLLIACLFCLDFRKHKATIKILII